MIFDLPVYKKEHHRRTYSFSCAQVTVTVFATSLNEARQILRNLISNADAFQFTKQL